MGRLEFKLSEEKVPDAVKSLRRLRKKVAENPRAQGRPPEFLCVITGIGSYAREVEEGIYVVPSGRWQTDTVYRIMHQRQSHRHLQPGRVLKDFQRDLPLGVKEFSSMIASKFL